MNENNISDALRDVRVALLEADVALPVVKDFIEQVRGKALGQAVMAALNPSEAFIKIVHEELVARRRERRHPRRVHRDVRPLLPPVRDDVVVVAPLAAGEVKHQPLLADRAHQALQKRTAERGARQKNGPSVMPADLI